MEGARGIEIEKKQQQTENTDSGFSEKRAARILEGKQTDNAQVKKRKPISSSVRQKILQQVGRRDSAQGQKQAKRTGKPVALRDKILAAYERNEKMVGELVRALGLSAQEGVQQEQIVLEIRGRQKIQEDLLNALVLEQQGKLSEDLLSKQLGNLIK